MNSTPRDFNVSTFSIVAGCDHIFPFIAGAMTTGLKNCDSLEIVVSVTENSTIGLRVYPHYKNGYINLNRARDGNALMRRLLNLSDGILGYGLRALLLITTNEPMRGLNPAVVRPGRCLADVQFRRFSHREALAWLDGTGSVPSSEATLAELYQARGDLHSIANPQPSSTATTYL